MHIPIHARTELLVLAPDRAAPTQPKQGSGPRAALVFVCAGLIGALWGRLGSPAAALAMLGREGDYVTRAPSRGPRMQLPGGFWTSEDLELKPGDLQFTDVDGDVVTLRLIRDMTGRFVVDMYVNGTLRFEKATVVRNGNTLEITGMSKTKTPLSFIGLNIENEETDGVTPQNQEDLERVVTLVGLE